MDKKLRKLPRHALLAAALGVVMLGGGTAALAYWSSSGGGTATATSARVAVLTVNQRSVISGIDPGVGPQTISGDFDNPGPGSVYVTSVTVGITVAKAPGAPAGICTAADYTLSGATMSVGAEIPAGSAVGSWGGATIQFNNSSTVFQDACKGAQIAFVYTLH